MVTVIQPRQGNTGTDLLAALNTVLGTIHENQQSGKAEQLKLLQILAQQPGASIEPVPAAQMQQPSFLDFIFGGQPRTLSGAPAARFGNQALQYVAPKRIDINTLLGPGVVQDVPMGTPSVPSAAPDATVPESPIRKEPLPSGGTGPQVLPGEGGSITDEVVRPPAVPPAPPAPQPYAPLSPSLIGPGKGPADLATRLTQAEQAVTYLTQKMQDAPTPKTQQMLDRVTQERDGLLAQSKQASTGQSSWQTVQPSPEVHAAASRASALTGVPVSHILGVGAVESALDPKATGPKTRFGWQAKGLMQLSPDTAKRLGGLEGDSDLYNVDQNAHVGALAWKEALQKASGDPRIAYQKYYNPGASDADTNRVMLSIRRFEHGGPDTSMMVAGAGAPAPTSTPAPGAATPSPPAAQARPQAPELAPPAWATDVQQQLKNAPATPYVRIQGLGIVEKPVYDTAMERLKATYPQGVLLDPTKGASQVYDTLHKFITEERTLRKDFEGHKKEALKEFGNLPEIRAATTPAQLAGTLDALVQRGASPEATRQSKIQDVRSYFGTLRRTYGEVPLDRVAQVEQGLLDAGVKAEVVQGIMKDYGIEGQREALKISQTAPAQAAAELQKLQTTGEEKRKQARETEVDQQQVRLQYGGGLPDLMRLGVGKVAADTGKTMPVFLADPFFGYRAQMAALDYQEEHQKRQVNQTPVPDVARRKVDDLMQAKRSLTIVRDSYAPEETQHFIGLIRGRLAAYGNVFKDLFSNATMSAEQRQAALERQYDQVVREAGSGLKGEQSTRYERFAADVKRIEDLAFNRGGTALSGHEIRVIFGYLPTLNDLTSGAFVAKLDSSVKHTDFALSLLRGTIGMTYSNAQEHINELDKSVDKLGEELRKQRDERVKAATQKPGQATTGAAAPTTPAPPPPAASAPAPQARPAAPAQGAPQTTATTPPVPQGQTAAPVDQATIKRTMNQAMQELYPGRAWTTLQPAEQTQVRERARVYGTQGR